jgi:transmembrane sensor
LAAGLAIFYLEPGLQPSPPVTEVTTGPGEHRTINLADGSSVSLNGSSHIRLSGLRTQESELISGEALFRIRHRADQPFVLKVGDDRVQDLGTTFNLTRDNDQVRVEVAEGAIRYRRGDSALQLRAGQTLDVDPGGDALVGHKTPLAIGAWNTGQLVYEDAPVADVAKDLGRNLGVSVSVAPQLALQQFTGSINLKGRPDKVIADFSSTIPARARKTQDGWLIQ